MTTPRSHTPSPGAGDTLVGPAALRRLRAEAPSGFTDAVLDRLGLYQGDRYVRMAGPAGDVFVAFNDAGISSVVPAGLVDGDGERFAARHQRTTGRAALEAGRPPAGLAAALRTGRAGRLRYDLSDLTPFERAVLLTTLEIPSGEVRPYGWVARQIGRPRAVRAVGSALGRNPVPVLIPCHRVVRSDGHVGQYGLGVPMKRALLSAEGVDLDRLERLAAAGVRFIASDSTGVFCVPSCPRARRVRAEHQVPLRSAADAVVAGFRPCAHCAPAPGRAAS